MTRKGLIVVEQMPLLLITQTISGTLIQSYIGVVRSSDRSCSQQLWKTKDIGICVPCSGEIKT